MREQLQIDTYLVLIITSAADELFGSTNVDDIKQPRTPRKRFLVNFSLFYAAILVIARWRHYCPRDFCYH